MRLAVTTNWIIPACKIPKYLGQPFTLKILAILSIHAKITVLVTRLRGSIQDYKKFKNIVTKLHDSALPDRTSLSFTGLYGLSLYSI